MAAKIDELINLIEKNARRQDDDIDALRLSVEDLRQLVIEQDETKRKQISVFGDTLKEQLNKHAEIERETAIEHEELIRENKIAIDNLCTAIQQITYERKKEQEREAIAKAVKDATGPHPLPSTSFSLATREGSGPVPLLDDSTLTPAQQRGIVKFVKKIWAYKFHIGGGAVGLHWLWERSAALVDWLKHMH